MASIDRNSPWVNLLPHQRQALEHIQEHAVRTKEGARARIGAVLTRAGLEERVYSVALQSLRTHARIGLHFHPERLSRNGKSVAEGLLESGVYKSQFETGLSSGSPSAYHGGERDLWEDRLFDGAYHVPGASDCDRPKYGALQVMCHPDGPAPRFGSCYFLLHPEMSRRSTFTFGGSHEEQAPGRTGTLDTLEPVMAPLLAELERGWGAFGVKDLTVPALLDQLTKGLASPLDNPQILPLGRALDSCLEVQVHGEIRLDQDVERLVVDPAFRDHPTGEVLAAIIHSSDGSGMSLSSKARPKSRPSGAPGAPAVARAHLPDLVRCPEGHRYALGSHPGYRDSESVLRAEGLCFTAVVNNEDIFQWLSYQEAGVQELLFSGSHTNRQEGGYFMRIP